MNQLTEEEKKIALTLLSNYELAQQKAREYLGKNTKLYISPRTNKKYRIYDPNNNKWIDFGSFNPPMEDYTLHGNEKRRDRYLKRATNIKGKWRDNPYSPNNLSINILW